MPAITLIPRKLDRARKHPLLALVHGGVHSNFGTSSAHIVRELVEQRYAVIAPDYRGSTGHGRTYYEQIDYGGREHDDVFRRAQLDGGTLLVSGSGAGGHPRLVARRHDHALNIFEHPEAYAVAFAGVPVNDLVARMGYKTESYRRLFSAPYHGKTAEENVNEYLRRSPVTHVHKLAKPLLIHTNTNDEDVNVLEMRRLIAALADTRSIGSTPNWRANRGRRFGRFWPGT